MHAVTICQSTPMTWILPKQLISAFAQDMEELTSDYAEQSRICARLLMRRSKRSPAKTYLREWKAGNLTRLQSGLISNPSLGERFVTEWTSSLAVTHANHSQPQESVSAQKTPATSGHSSQTEFAFFAPECASLKMSRDTSVSDCERSLANWNQWVTKCRGEYSQRVKSAHHINESESSSLQWPTTAARDYKGTSPGYLFRADGKSRVDQLAVAVDQAEIGNWPTPTVQEAGKIGNQANHGQIALSNHPSLRGEVNREKFKKGYSGHLAPVNPSTDLNHPGLLSDAWPTPTALSRVRDEETMQKCLKFRQGNGQTTVPLYLEERVNIEEKSRLESWATPECKNHVGYQVDRTGAMWPRLGSQVKAWETPTVSTGGHRQADGLMTPKLDQQVKSWATPRAGCPGSRAPGTGGKVLEEQVKQVKQSGKLNPRWVETLMGLPVGWTMPSCANPVTIELTNCACSETELCQQPQP